MKLIELEIIESKPGKPFLRAIEKSTIKIYTGAYVLKNKTKVILCVWKKLIFNGEKIQDF